MTRKKRLSSILTVIAILGAGMGIMLLLSFRKVETQKVEESIVIREVHTQKLFSKPVQVWIESNGFLVSSKSLTLISVMGGRITFAKDNLKGGTPVERDEVLIQLDNRAAENTFHKARLELLRLSSGFLSQIEQNSGNTSQWKNYIDLLASPRTRKIPPPPTQKGRENLMAATQGILSAWHNLDGAALVLEQHEIRAPFDGTLSGEGVTQGSFISSGISLAELIDTRNLEVPVTISEKDLGSIELNAEVLVTHDSSSEEIYGSVDRIEPLLQAGAAVIHIRLTEIPEFSSWLPGTFVSVSIKGDYLSRAYQVPRRILLNDKLPVFREGKLYLEPVTILGSQGEDIFLKVTFPEETEMIITTLQTPLEGMLLKKGESNAPDA